MSLTDINLREKDFHNDLHLNGNSRLSQNKFYKAIFNIFRDFDKYLEENSTNKVILDYGCGVGDVTRKTAKYNPSKIIGADISDVSIEKASKKSKELNLDIEYRVENCENTNFNSNTFDLIYGTGILHHLNLEKSINEINRILKKNGSMIFLEPMGTNPFINLYRKFTPKARSIDEHPFVSKDFKFLQKTFGKLDLQYYGFFTLIFIPFYKDPENSYFYKLLAFLDKLIFKIKFLRFLSWSVLIIAKKV